MPLALIAGKLSDEPYICWDTDFEGIDKQDLAVKLCLIFLCATMTSLTRAKTEYILTYRVFLFILKRSV